MKVLLINGSSRENGCTFTALSQAVHALEKEGVQTEIIQLGAAPLRDCVGCNACRKLNNRCVFNDDIVNKILEKAQTADGFIFGSPVYYAHPSGRILSLMNRLFYAGGSVFARKPAAAVVSARRAGTTAALDAIQKHFTINQMPVVSSFYWNMVHGNTPEEVRQDLEGLQVIRTLGRNMAWLLKCLEAGKKAGVAAPEPEERAWTNFIR